MARRLFYQRNDLPKAPRAEPIQVSRRHSWDEVCWQGKGIRQDKRGKDQPLAVEQDKRSEDVRFLDAQSPQQDEAFNRWLKEDQAETQALMSAQSQRMEAVRKAVETKKKK